MLLVKRKKIPDGEPCDHPGCLSHISHPCEGCGRIGGFSLPNLPGFWWQYFAHLESIRAIAIKTIAVARSFQNFPSWLEDLERTVADEI